MSHITELRASNVKNLVAVRISPTGPLTCISGENGAGKSSVLDSILYALCGKDAFPVKPVRDGEERADIEITLDSGLVVKRYVTVAGTTGLSVFARDGAKYPSPQKVLDELTGKLTFDPLAFLKLDPPAQAATLRKLVGLDTAATDAEIKRVYEERTTVNRRLTEMRAAVTQMPATHTDAPSVEVSSADVLSAIEKAQAHNAERTELVASQNGALREFDIHKAASIAAETLVASLEKQLETAKAALPEAKRLFTRSQDILAKANQSLAAFQLEDTTALSAQLKSCEATNAKVRANAQRAKAVAEGQAKKLHADALTAQLTKLESDKAAALAAVKFPVDGLELDGDTLLFNKLPLSQVNTAQQIRVGVAISAALSPKLKVILVRNGNDLDAKGLETLAAMAEELGCQCWVERIEGGVGSVQIEDGEVVGAAPVEPEKPKRKTKVLPAPEASVKVEGRELAMDAALERHSATSAAQVAAIDPGF